MAALTLQALVDAGATVTVVTPDDRDAEAPPGLTWCPVDQPRRSWARALASAVHEGSALTLARHAMPAVAARVAGLAAGRAFDVVHAEQVQAVTAARAARLPLVVRVHNVEHEVWARVGGWRGPLARVESRRLARAESAIAARADAIVTLSADDRDALKRLAPTARLHHVPPAGPHPREPGPPLDGAPACVWLGSGGWPPNRAARDWLIDRVWPAIAATTSGARLHLFDDGPCPAGSAITRHGRPRDSRHAFAAGACLLVPLLHPAGIRMRMLEAWAAGVPVIATTAAVRGLEARPGRDVALADTPEAFAAAVARLARDASWRAALVEGGRQRLASLHEGGAAAEALLEVYRGAMARHAAR